MMLQKYYHMKKLLILLFTVLFALSLQAQQKYSNIIPEELLIRKEIYVNLQLKQNQDIKYQLDLLNKTISIDSYDSDQRSAKAYISLNKYNSFLKLEYDYQILTPPSLLLPKSELDDRSNKNSNEWDYYPNYSQYLEMMYQFETDYPNLCEVVNIGQSTEGREILFVHINNNLGEDENEPEFMYTSSMHGDEITAYVLMLRYIDYLLSNYGDNSRITSLVDDIDIWINPLANPDGTFAGGNSSVSGATRSNANGVDLNRNYPDPEDGPHPDENPYQPETLLFMDFANEHNFVMSANFHGGAEVVNYPWDTWSRLAADDDWWYFVSREYADTIHQYSPAGYFSDFNNGITNGYAWYSISGGRQDYMNYFEHCREVTLEVSDTKMPPGSQMPLFWNYNYRSLLNYMEQVLYGVRGVVTNLFNGNTIKAKVFIDSHDIDESHIYSSAPAGNYHRLLKQGTYDFTFSTWGYYDKTITNVDVSDYQTIILDVELEPNVGSIETNNYKIAIFPNPAQDYVEIKLSETGNHLIKLFDNTGRLVYNKTSTNNSLIIPLTDYVSGIYIVSVSNEKGDLFSTKLVVK